MTFQGGISLRQPDRMSDPGFFHPCKQNAATLQIPDLEHETGLSGETISQGHIPIAPAIITFSKNYYK